LKDNYLKRKNDIYYSLENNETAIYDEDPLKHSKDKKLKKLEEPPKIDQTMEPSIFKRYVLYSHENRGSVHNDDKETSEAGLGKSEGKINESGEGNDQLMNYLESAAKYYRNCILLLKNKYKNENFGFVESKFEIKVEKNERKTSGEENKEAEVNKFSEKFERFFKKTNNFLIFL
jgi:hypothetical protein